MVASFQCFHKPAKGDLQMDFTNSLAHAKVLQTEKGNLITFLPKGLQSALQLQRRSI